MLYKDIDLMLENNSWLEKLNEAKKLYSNRRNSVEDLSEYRRIRKELKAEFDLMRI